MPRLSEELIQAAHAADIKSIGMLKAAGHSLLGVCEEGSDLLYHFIWRCGDYDMVDQLIAMGCRPANTNAKSGTPLVAAIWCNRPKLVKLVLDAGADPNVIGFIGDDEVSALDAVVSDYCNCETEEELSNLKEIEKIIRAAGGKFHSQHPQSGYITD